MKSGITRWKMVPSYSGVLCLVAWLTGLVQSFAPVARSMKFLTVIGVSFSKSLQRSVPAVVSKTAVGSPDFFGAAVAGFAAGLAGAAFGGASACAHAATEVSETRVAIANILRMRPPYLRTK